MDAIKYLKEKARMCDSVSGCHNCPFTKEIDGVKKVCGSFQKKYPEEAVAIVEKWSAEHPKKTILQDFLEKYPNAPLKNNSCPSFCPSILGYKFIKCSLEYCMTCKECWNRPLEG